MFFPSNKEEVDSYHNPCLIFFTQVVKYEEEGPGGETRAVTRRFCDQTAGFDLMFPECTPGALTEPDGTLDCCEADKCNGAITIVGTMAALVAGVILSIIGALL